MFAHREGMRVSPPGIRASNGAPDARTSHHPVATGRIVAETCRFYSDVRVKKLLCAASAPACGTSFRPGHVMTQVLQHALGVSVAPKIRRGYPQNDGRDLPHDSGTAWPFRRERPLPGDQVAMLPEDHGGRHDGRDLPQDPSAASASVRREASALIIGQPAAASGSIDGPLTRRRSW
jgi:hypothetical protein